MKRLILWDIDGTLINTGRSYDEHLLFRRLGRDLPEHDIAFAGKTDPQIMRELLIHAGTDNVDDVLPLALRELERLVRLNQPRMRVEGTIMPGVIAALQAFAKEPRVAQTVLTGNLAAAAQLKLETFGLDAWLDSTQGATGSDHEDRRSLVPVALRRASAHFGHAFTAEETWIIGDARGDYECAAAAGAHCLLVRTSIHRGIDHDGCEPDAIFEDLTDTDAVVKLVLA